MIDGMLAGTTMAALSGLSSDSLGAMASAAPSVGLEEPP
jgi:hypothetical protein